MMAIFMFNEFPRFPFSCYLSLVRLFPPRTSNMRTSHAEMRVNIVLLFSERHSRDHTHTHTHTAATAQREKEAATGLEPLKHTRCYRQTNSARTRQDNLSFEVSSSFSLYGTNRKKKRRVPLEKFWWRREFKWRIKKPIATRIRPSELALSLWRICRVAFAIGSEKEARIAPFALYACVPIY